MTGLCIGLYKQAHIHLYSVCLYAYIVYVYVLSHIVAMCGGSICFMWENLQCFNFHVHIVIVWLQFFYDNRLCASVFMGF